MVGTILCGIRCGDAVRIAQLRRAFEDRHQFEMTNCNLKERLNDKYQVANTWTKITARYGYAMVRNGKEPENLDFSSVAATFEKAIT